MTPTELHELLTKKVGEMRAAEDVWLQRHRSHSVKREDHTPNIDDPWPRPIRTWLCLRCKEAFRIELSLADALDLLASEYELSE